MPRLSPKLSGPLSLFEQILAYSKQHNLIPNGARVIIGLSGGPDSVLLTHFLLSLKKSGSRLGPTSKPIDLIAAHLDHEWRQESSRDAQFCASLCAQLDITFVSSTLSELNIGSANNGSKEAFARTARRLFFERVRKKHHADVIALAHHAQDQQETFFIRLIRGAGTTGLAAIHPKMGNYIRPLLEINKDDILNYLTQHNLPFLTDPTNTSLDFLRNRIRHSVIPALQATDQRFDHNFQRAIHNLHSTEQFLIETTQSLFKQITTHDQNKIMLDTVLFQKQHALMQHRILIHLLILEQVAFTPTQHFIQEIIRFINQPKQHRTPASVITKIHRMHSTWQLVKQGAFVFIEKHSST